MTEKLNIVMAQLNLVVGDIDYNSSLVINSALEARDHLKADIIVFPELTLCGYPPEDLLLRSSMVIRMEQTLDKLSVVRGIDMIIGLPLMGPNGLENQAIVMRDGEIIAQYGKQELPNYHVFDEKRYFVKGQNTVIYTCQSVKIALLICEDLWYQEPIGHAKQLGAQLIISLNASPFDMNKHSLRHQLMKRRCLESGLPILYVNLVGGQDELVFDGSSFAMNSDGELVCTAQCFNEELVSASFDKESMKFDLGKITITPDVYSMVYDALVMGVRDYVNKNGFKGVVMGLSGGIDSALTLAIATDALGNERVHTVMMPYRYTSDMSLEDAAEQANILSVEYSIIPIDTVCDAFTNTLRHQFVGFTSDTTEENIQSRSRGVILMALSNKKKYLVLTTGNKSEMAVGYTTLYGDMAGGLDVLKDVSKTLVYKLSEYRNTRSRIIPQRVIDRPPSAELAPDQRDDDNLPPYSELDSILELYIEQDQSAESIINKGFDKETVYRIVRLVDANEHKRRQSAIGIRITSRGFGRDRRYPVTNRWEPGV